MTVVGPVESGHVTFRGGPERSLHEISASVAYEVPRNTLDPRYATCTDHHVACDCREAELNEILTEYRMEAAHLRTVIAEALDGHFVYVDGRDENDGCMCTGCQIVRRAGLPCSSFARWAKADT